MKDFTIQSIAFAFVVFLGIFSFSIPALWMFFALAPTNPIWAGVFWMFSFFGYTAALLIYGMKQ